MDSKTILQKYLDFYKERGHALIPNVSLVPENDPTLLFVNSGMFPLVPYLSGETHPMGKRLVNVQRSLRLADLEEIGDKSHTLAFHMIGNWSLGDYFKKEQLPWAYEFLIDVLGIDPHKLAATVFAGDTNAPTDNESIEIIKKVFAKYGVEAEVGKNIWLYSKEQGNWWQRGDAVGELGGPSSEVFYYFGEGSLDGKSPEKFENEFLEIGNSVFMEYKRVEGGWEKLPQSNVDFGGGLERIAWVCQRKHDIYETDNFYPIVKKIEELTGKKYGESPEVTRAMRIIADHMRGSCFIAMDGVVPNKDGRGYILRRLLRRMTRFGKVLGYEQDLSSELVGVVVEMFSWLYPTLREKQDEIKKMFVDEEVRFRKALEEGIRNYKKRLQKNPELPTNSLQLHALTAFDLFQSLGIPDETYFENFIDPADHYGYEEFKELFNNAFSSHKAQSRAGAEKQFKGGLADQSDQVIKYHTATHLLHKALRTVLGESVAQKGSNITGERLRFDFSYDQKLTPAQLAEVEALMNKRIAEELPVNFVDLPKEEAEKSGALHFFGEKYGDIVRVYFIGDSVEKAYSKEFCGGPHVKNTKEIGQIRLYKTESIGKGLQRVYGK